MTNVQSKSLLRVLESSLSYDPTCRYMYMLMCYAGCWRDVSVVKRFEVFFAITFSRILTKWTKDFWVENEEVVLKYAMPINKNSFMTIAYMIARVIVLSFILLRGKVFLTCACQI